MCEATYSSHRCKQLHNARSSFLDVFSSNSRGILTFGPLEHGSHRSDFELPQASCGPVVTSKSTIVEDRCDDAQSHHTDV